MTICIRKEHLISNTNKIIIIIIIIDKIIIIRILTIITYRHDITEILLRVALNIISQTLTLI